MPLLNVLLFAMFAGFRRQPPLLPLPQAMVLPLLLPRLLLHLLLLRLPAQLAPHWRLARPPPRARPPPVPFRRLR